MNVRDTPGLVRPVFGDEVMVSFLVKKTKEGNQDPVVRIGFVDALRKQMVADVVITPATARALVKMMQGTLDKLDGAIKGKLPVKKQDETTYIG
ncbi:MAG: hypothetical protein GOU99_02220 [Candidatus Altiarchaeota archaeon]|nr:hypothetical protein [Candidatus Altiarchaeota archaeon]